MRTGDVDQVGDDRARGGLRARARAVVHRRPDRVAFDQHRVHHALDVGDQARLRNQRRVDAQLDPLRRAPRDPKELDPVAQRLGVANILARQLRDALGVGLVELHRHAECDRRHDGELVRGVYAFDVEGGIGLGVAARLRLLQYRVERGTLRAHLGQDEVRRAVDDPGDPLDPVGGEPFAQRLDDRDAARDRALERDHHALRVRGGEDLVAVSRQQRLVGRHHMLVVGDGLQDERARRLDAADQLDHDVDVRMREHRPCVCRQGDARCPAGDLARAFLRLFGDPCDADRTPRTAGDLLLVPAQHGPGAEAYGAEPEQSDLERLQSLIRHH